MRNINERLDEIGNKIKENKFVDGRGLGNEISFYIFDYDPKDELKVRDKVKSLHKAFKNPIHNRRIIEFDLYKMLLDLAKEKGIYEQIFTMEEELGDDELFKALTTFAKPEVFLDKIEAELGD